MTDPAAGDRRQQNEAIERDTARDDEESDRISSEVGLTERADPDGSAWSLGGEEQA